MSKDQNIDVDAIVQAAVKEAVAQTRRETAETMEHVKATYAESFEALKADHARQIEALSTHAKNMATATAQQVAESTATAATSAVEQITSASSQLISRAKAEVDRTTETLAEIRNAEKAAREQISEAGRVKADADQRMLKAEAAEAKAKEVEDRSNRALEMLNLQRDAAVQKVASEMVFNQEEKVLLEELKERRFKLEEENEARQEHIANSIRSFYPEMKEKLEDELARLIGEGKLPGEGQTPAKKTATRPKR